MHPDDRPLSRPQRLALTAASFLLVAVAAMALGPLISGSAWWWLCAFVAAVTLFGGAGLRALRVPGGLVPFGELVILLLLLTMVFGGSTSFALIVPTVDTFPLFGDLFEGAQRTIQQQAVPAIAVPALAFMLALGVGVLAVCVDVLVQTVRMPALAAAPALVPILIPGFIIESGTELPALVFSAAAYLLLLRVDVRVRRRANLAARADDDRAATVVPPARTPVASGLMTTLGLTAAGILVAAVLAASTPSISTSLLLGTGS
ncbi:MAG TPA: transglutaminaseTgpA domain-containing protein, partial [Agromyces sp.]